MAHLPAVQHKLKLWLQFQHAIRRHGPEARHTFRDGIVCQVMDMERVPCVDVLRAVAVCGSRRACEQLP